MDNDDDENDEMKVPSPEPESETAATKEEAPVGGQVVLPVDALIAQGYMQKGLFFLVIMGLVIYIVRRRRAAYQKVDEKSVA